MLQAQIQTNKQLKRQAKQHAIGEMGPVREEEKNPEKIYTKFHDGEMKVGQIY